MDETGSDEPQTTGVALESTPPSTSASKTNSSTEQQDSSNPTLKIIRRVSRQPSTSALSFISREGTPPPLPPRPKPRAPYESRPSTSHSVAPSRPSLVSEPTTQLSYADSHTHSNESRDASSSGATTSRSYFGLNIGRNTNGADDSASVRSSAPTVDANADTESMLGEIVGGHEKPLLRSLRPSFEDKENASMFTPDPEFEDAFTHEFDEIEDMRPDGSNEG
jgi:hypothetical protein